MAVGIVSSIVFLTFFIAGAAGVGFGFTANNAGSTTRMARTQTKITSGKIQYDTPKARRIFKRGIIKAWHTQAFDNKDLLMDVNSFPTSSNVNSDKDFEQLLKFDSYRGHRDLKRLYRYKGKMCFRDLGRGLSDRAQRRRDKKLAKFEEKGVKDVIKESGFIKSKVEDYGINGSHVVPIAVSKSGKEYHDCRYSMASKPVVDYVTEEEKFKPSSLFGKLINKQTSTGKSYIKAYGSSSLNFARFGIDYPTETGVDADRFILGCSNLTNPMYQASKLLVLAKACGNFNASKQTHEDGSVGYGIDKVRIIEGTRGKEKATVLKADKFKEYMSAYVTSSEYINSLNELGAIDPKAVDYIENMVNEFVPTRRVESAAIARPATIVRT